MRESPIVSEFKMYEHGLEPAEREEIARRLVLVPSLDVDRFRAFTDVLAEYVGSGEWKSKSNAFLSMAAKACYLRGMYGYNQILARGTSNLACKGYAAAAYCRQSFDPRWLNNLRTYVNQTWQSKDLVAFAELSGQLAKVLVDLGYAEHSKQVATESIDKVLKATAGDTTLRESVERALLRPKTVLAYISGTAESLEDAMVRLDEAHEAAKALDHRLAETDATFYRSRLLYEFGEYSKATELVKAAYAVYERMGYLEGVAESGNLLGILLMHTGELQEARDVYEDIMIIQHQLNNQFGLANSLINVGEIDRMLGQFEQMESYNRRALEISQEAEFVRGMTIANINLGDVALRKGDLDGAIQHYQTSIDLAAKSGLKHLLIDSYVMLGDAFLLKQDLKSAVDCYSKAGEVSQSVDSLIDEFNARVSTVVAYRCAEQEPPEHLVRGLLDTLGGPDKWRASGTPLRMRDVRRKILGDRSIEGNLCIFFQADMNFQCRVDRMTLRKECFGNLFWKAQLCTYFLDFIEYLGKRAAAGNAGE